MSEEAPQLELPKSGIYDPENPNGDSKSQSRFAGDPFRLVVNTFEPIREGDAETLS